MTTQSISSSQYTQLLSMFTSQGYSSSQASSYLNSIFAVGTDAYVIAKGNHQERTAATENLIGTVANICLQLFSGIGSAKSDVKKGDKDIQDGKNAAEKTAKDTKKTVDEILEEIGDNQNGFIGNIQNALAKIEEIGSEQIQKEVVEAINERIELIQEEVAKIEAIQAGTSEEDGDPTKQIETHLDKISEYRGEINDLVTKNIPELNAQIQEQNKMVVENTDNIAAKGAEAEKALMDGLKEMKISVTKMKTESTAYNVQLETKGTAQTAQGEAELAAAKTGEITGLATFGATTLIGAAEEGKALKHIEEGQTRMEGGGQNMMALGKAIGELGPEYTELANVANSIGSKLTDAATVIGQYNTKVTPYITSLGTIDAVTNGLKDGGELDNTIKEDKQIISKANYQELCDNGVITEPSMKKSNKKSQNEFLNPIETLELKTPKFVKELKMVGGTK